MNPRQSSESRRHDDTGSIGITSFFAIMSFIMLLAIGVAGMRTFIGAGDLQSAAQSGARAAALEHDLAAAQVAARRVIDDELAQSDEACDNAVVAVTAGVGGFGPGGSVVVNLSCTVHYNDVYLPGLPSSRLISVSATEPRDCLLGGGTAGATNNCYYGG